MRGEENLEHKARKGENEKLRYIALYGLPILPADKRLIGSRCLKQANFQDS